MSQFIKSVLVFLLLVTTACSGAVSGSNAPPVFSGTYTLQGTILDAVAGKRLGGDTLEVYLQQGTNQRRPDRMVKDANDPMVGDFAFNGIPLAYNNGNITYRLIILNQGYIRFESDIRYSAQSSSVIDGTYNFMGDVYLFPVGTQAPTYRFQLLFNTKPVPGAPAYLVPKSSSNTPLTSTSGFTIPATSGYLENVSARSGADGVVEFSGSSLALGAAYVLVIPPVVFEGVQLGQFTGTTDTIIGKTQSTQVVNLPSLTPGATTMGLYITNASNTVAGQVSTSGALSVTFSRKVILNNGNNFWATTNSSGSFPTAPGKRVNASLSGDGLTLTLTPAWGTAPTTSNAITKITYSSAGVANGMAANPSISVDGYPAITFDLFRDLKLRDGSAPSADVFLSGP